MSRSRCLCLELTIRQDKQVQPRCTLVDGRLTHNLPATEATKTRSSPVLPNCKNGDDMHIPSLGTKYVSYMWYIMMVLSAWPSTKSVINPTSSPWLCRVYLGLLKIAFVYAAVACICSAPGPSVQSTVQVSSTAWSNVILNPQKTHSHAAADVGYDVRFNWGT